MRSDFSLNTTRKEKAYGVLSFMPYKEKTAMVLKPSEKATFPKKQKTKTKKDAESC